MTDPGTTSASSTLADEPVCYLTTVGRVSGQPRTIEIWFAMEGATLYLLSGGGDRAHWVRNLRRDPAVRVRIREAVWHGRARVLGAGPEAERARTAVYAKYQPGYRSDLRRWRDASLPVAVDTGTPLDQEASGG